MNTATATTSEKAAAYLDECDRNAREQVQARARRPLHDAERETAKAEQSTGAHVPTVRKAADFARYVPAFIWQPYILRREYNLLIADSGTGKTYLLCKIAADLSAGRALFGSGEPLQAAEKRRTLFISSEDDGGILRERLERCGADLDYISICDRSDSIGVDFTAPTFCAMLEETKPDLVILDPWQAFCSDKVDPNRMNQMRQALQKLANAARVYNCAIVLVSHVNKRAQESNANYAAAGSGELVNAARSAMILCYDDSEPERRDLRLLVHTKANHSILGKSLRVQIDGDGVHFLGTSEVDKSTLELKAKTKSTFPEALEKQRRCKTDFSELCRAVRDALERSGETACRCTYRTLEMFGNGRGIWNGMQPARAIGCARQELHEMGLEVFTIDKQIRDKFSAANGRGVLICDRTADGGAE